MSVFDGIKLPTVIFETNSGYNGKISVIEVGSTRKLSVDGTVQSVNWTSPSVEKLVWGKVIKVLKENEPGLRSILVLGLGGGTTQQLISKEFNGVQIVSVEIDAVMVDVARKFFALEQIPNHRVIIDDALRVIANPKEYGIDEYFFDAVFVDIYCGQTFPDLGKSGTFLSGIMRLVKHGGLVVFNRIYIESHQDDVNLFIEMIEGYLQGVKSLIVAGKTNSDNVLIFGRTL